MATAGIRPDVPSCTPAAPREVGTHIRVLAPVSSGKSPQCIPPNTPSCVLVVVSLALNFGLVLFCCLCEQRARVLCPPVLDSFTFWVCEIGTFAIIFLLENNPPVCWEERAARWHTNDCFGRVWCVGRSENHFRTPPHFRTQRCGEKHSVPHPWCDACHRHGRAVCSPKARNRRPQVAVRRERLQ